MPGRAVDLIACRLSEGNESGRGRGEGVPRQASPSRTATARTSPSSSPVKNTSSQPLTLISAGDPETGHRQLRRVGVRFSLVPEQTGCANESASRPGPGPSAGCSSRCSIGQVSRSAKRATTGRESTPPTSARSVDRKQARAASPLIRGASPRPSPLPPHEPPSSNPHGCLRACLHAQASAQTSASPWVLTLTESYALHPPLPRSRRSSTPATRSRVRRPVTRRRCTGP